MKTSVRWVSDVQFVAEMGSGHAVVVDGAPEYGGRNTGVRPMELVLAGAATCTAFDVILMLAKARQKVTRFTVDAEAARAETDPKVFTAIKLTYRIAGPAVDPKAVERAVRLSREKYCSATAMLGRTAEISTEIVIETEPTGTEGG
ncbi:MAG: OsmC family protein [Casimicrobiaceae bacterium]